MQGRLIAAVVVLAFLVPSAGAAIEINADRAVPAIRGEPRASLAAEQTPWWERSALDEDRDAVHDSLEALAVADFPVVIIVDYKRPPGDGDVGILERLGIEIGVVLETLDALTAQAQSLAQIRLAAAQPEVVMVEMGGRPYAANDVAAPAIKAEESDEYSPETAWELGVTGKGIIISIMDTGVDNAHPGLAGKWLGGVDVSKPESRLTPRDGSFDADDNQGHGTSCAGMAMGTGAPEGVYNGIAPGANLVDLRIGTIFGAAPGEGPQNAYDGTLQGIDWAIRMNDHAWQGGGAGIDILSLSWGNNVGGSSDGSDMYSRGIDRLVQAGIIAVIAAGNAGPSNDGFDGLGASSYAITIGATDDHNTVDRDDDNIADYSSRGPRADNNDGYPYDEFIPDVSAPGTDIISAEFDRVGDGSGNSYGPRGSGTSYATPMVAGTVALMLEANPDLKDQWRLVQEILTSTAERRGEPSAPDIDPFWNKDFGYGMVDAYAAVKLARALKGITDTVDPELQAFITNTSAGNRSVSDSITLRGVSYAKRGAVETVEVQVDDGAWIRIASPLTSNQSAFEYTIDTRGFTDGNHTVRVRAQGAGLYSLESEQEFTVQGASARVNAGVPGSFLFFAAAIALCAPAAYYVYTRQARAREMEQYLAQQERLENF